MPLACEFRGSFAYPIAGGQQHPTSKCFSREENVSSPSRPWNESVGWSRPPQKVDSYHDCIGRINTSFGDWSVLAAVVFAAGAVSSDGGVLDFDFADVASLVRRLDPPIVPK